MDYKKLVIILTKKEKKKDTPSLQKALRGCHFFQKKEITGK